MSSQAKRTLQRMFMNRPSKISYDIFLTRVKKKITLLGFESYPLHIRIRAGQNMTYRKSYLFSLLQQPKFQQVLPGKGMTISIEDIVIQEKEILNKVVGNATPFCSLETLLQDYEFYAQDILNELGNRFCEFMVDFFNDMSLPFYSEFIIHGGANHTCEFLLENISKALHPNVFEKLLRSAAHSGPPYIPIKAFHNKIAHGALPVFPVYYWLEKGYSATFANFIKDEFPTYAVEGVHNYIYRLIGTS